MSVSLLLVWGHTPHSSELPVRRSKLLSVCIVECYCICVEEVIETLSNLSETLSNLSETLSNLSETLSNLSETH